MPEGPLGGPRPFAQTQAEVNFYFEERGDELSEHMVTIGTVLYNNPHLGDLSAGPEGELNNVISTSTSQHSNQITISSINDTVDRIEEATGLSVEDVEVIF